VARVDHGQRDIDHVDERLPQLTDADVAAERRRDTEHVRRRAHRQIGQLLTSVGQKTSNGIDSELALAPLEHRARHIRLGSVGKPDVVPLDLREAHLGDFAGDGDVVLPDITRERIEPDDVLAVDPDAPRGVLYSIPGSAGREDGVLHHRDPRDRVDPFRFQAIEQGREIPDSSFAIGPDLQGQRDGRVMADVSRDILDIDDKRIDLGLAHDLEDLRHAFARARRPRIHVQAAHVLGAGKARVFEVGPGQRLCVDERAGRVHVHLGANRLSGVSAREIPSHDGRVPSRRGLRVGTGRSVPLILTRRKVARILSHRVDLGSRRLGASAQGQAGRVGEFDLRQRPLVRSRLVRPASAGGESHQAGHEPTSRDPTSRHP
jgi:hypothetical protein